MSTARRSHGRGPRKARLLILVIAALAAMLMVVGCGSSSSSSSTGTESAEGGEESSKTTAAGGEAEGGGDSEGGSDSGLKVGVLIPGTQNDGSWGEAVSEGAEEAGKKYGAEVTIAANLEEPSQYQQQGLAMAQAGYDLIIIGHAAMASVTQELAAKFPETKFGQVAVAVEPLPENVASSTPELPVGTFQAGVLAALMSKTGTVGMIGGYEFPALTSEMEGFALGARYADPQVKILRTYINSFVDAGKAKAAAQAQTSQGADIIFSATDQATQGIYQVAEGGGSLQYVIPQYLDKSEQAPNVVLTSVVYNLQGASASFIEMLAEDEWKSENVEFGIENGVGLAPNPAMKIPPGVEKEMDEVDSKLESGALTIPSIEELGENESAESVDLKSVES
jgi:basic membrane protein A